MILGFCFLGMVRSRQRADNDDERFRQSLSSQVVVSMRQLMPGRAVDIKIFK